jgi:hypothetical protein
MAEIEAYCAPPPRLASNCKGFTTFFSVTYRFLYTNV